MCIDDMKKLGKGLKQEDFQVPSNKKGAVFWSTANPRKRDRSNNNDMKAAQDYADTKNKVTVEMTKGGRILDEMQLFSFKNRACTDEDLAKAAYYWNCASMWFAQARTSQDMD